MLRKLFISIGALVMASAAFAATIPYTTTPTDPSQIVFLLNNLINQINSGVTPTTMGNTLNFRNALDNGAMNIQQRGTGTATCATTAGLAVASYASDRWGCDVNVSSGAGQLTPITASPSPPLGFQNSLKLNRNSGALTQTQCAWQEIPTSRAVQLQGQAVVFSSNVQALAGLAADNGNAFSLVIITGTGTDQGMGALRSAVGMTASPAITPAWTGIATPVNQAFTATTSWARYVTNPFTVATTVTEMAVGVCFTPTATGAGATDGLAFTGAQLEVSTSGASAYENRTNEDEQARALAFYWQFAEVNGQEFGNGACQATNVPKVVLQLPRLMQGTPALAWTAGGFSLNIAGAAAAGATGGAGANLASATTLGAVNLSFNNTCTAGGTIALVGTNTTGLVTVSADF